MQISQLPTIPQAPANADVLAIEVNGITYKVSKSALAAAIITHLGGDPVTVAHGGTGAVNAAAARTNLGITPANIGALPLGGGTMTGDINMGQSSESSGAKNVIWTTADGTVFRLRPYNNIMQLTRQASGGSQSNVIGVNSDGTYSVGNTRSFRTAIGASSGVWPVSLGGTGGSSIAEARENLSAACNVIFDSSDTTAAKISARMSDVNSAGATNVTVPGTVMDVLTGGKYTGGCYGTAVRFTTNDYRFDLCAYNGQNRYCFACTITSSAVTPGTVYRYSGTAI